MGRSLTIWEQKESLEQRYKFHKNIERLNCQDLYSIEIIN